MSETKPGPVPIRKVVVRWACPFCPRESAQKEALDKHVPQCWKNPEMKTCLTCTHQIRSTSDGAPAGCALGLAVPEGPRPVVGCPAWTKRSKKKQSRTTTEDGTR